MTLHSLTRESHATAHPWESRKVTIKELASKLGVSVPTLRKYGECGLLDVDCVMGRTNLFDEAAAIARVEEINRLKSRGYSLALIREKLEQRPAGFVPLDLGLEGATFTRGRHALVVMEDMDEYISFARKFMGNALRAEQGLILVADPAHRPLYEKILSSDGLDFDAAMKRRQICFAWFEGGQRLDAERQVGHYDALVRVIHSAGWREIRILGQPGNESLCGDGEGLEDYEERLTLWARNQPVIIACAWIAPRAASKELLRSQRLHRELVLGEHVFLQP